MSNFLKRLKSADGYTPSFSAGSLPEEIGKVGIGVLPISELYPETKKFSGIAKAVLALATTEVDGETLLTTTVPVSLARIENGVLEGRYYSPISTLIRSEITSADGTTTIELGIPKGFPADLLKGFLGAAIRYAISKSGNSTPTDRRNSPTSRYNTKPGFVFGFGTDYLRYSRKYAESPDGLLAEIGRIYEKVFPEE